MPRPNPGERKKSYLARCMSDSSMTEKYANRDQRYAVCQSLWRRGGDAAESKQLRSTENHRVQQQLDLAARNMPDSVKRRRMQNALDALRAEYVRLLRQIVDRVSRSDLNAGSATELAADIMIRMFGSATQMGFVIAGVPAWKMTDDQLQALASMVAAETKFFLKWMLTLEMSKEQRIDLYGGGVFDAFWRGWVMALPSNARITWNRTAVESCESCLSLVDGNPYTKPGAGGNELPEIPRGISLICGHNCKCFLSSDGAFISGLFNRIEIEVTKIGSQTVDPTSVAARGAASIYQSLAERYAYYLRLSIVVPSGPYATLAKAALDEIHAMAKRMGHTVRLAQSDAEILEPVRIDQALKWKFIDPTKEGWDDDLLLLIATVIAINEVDRGKITKIEPNPPRITLDDDPERTYRLDSTGRALLFIEAGSL